MNTSIFRTIAIGALVGLLFFVAFRVVIVFAILGLIFKLSGKGRMKKQHWKDRKLAYVENIRNMNDDEFEQFKSNANHHYCHSYYSTTKSNEAS